MSIERHINEFISEYSVKNHQQAKIKIDNLIKKYPNEKKLLQTAGILFAQNKKFEDAIKIFKKILEKDQQSVETLINIGITYYESNKFDQAIEYLEKAENLDMRQDEVFYNLGLVYEKKKIPIKAIEYYQKTIKIDSSNIGAFINLGNIFLQNNNFKKAIYAYENAIMADPNDPNIYHNLGVAWSKIENIDKAIDNYLKAIQLNSKNPLTYYNLGYLYSQNSNFELSKLELAEIKFKNAIEIDPNTAKFYYNLAWVETKLGKHDSAIGHYIKALNINPNYTSARFNLSRLHLIKENFQEGWPNYDKIRLNKFEKDPIYLKKFNNILKLKKWHGEKFDGKLFVYGEQGVGDEILYSSMLPDLSRKHSDISLSVDNRLVSLFKRSFKNISVSAYENTVTVNASDRQVPLFSLGSYFRKSINDFKPIPYIIPNPEKVQYYRNILSKNKKFKVGLSWRSKSNLAKDKNISLREISKFFTIEDFEYINLQYGDTLTEREKLKSDFGIELTNIDDLDLMNDFEGLAALMASCDLVITITNATAQLAGSIGLTTWIILPLYHPWQWFLKRNNSLWYPNVKIFRQTSYENWDNVIKNMHHELLEIKK